ncbi:hypothetical protein DAPPUDRAFT_249536 [Daphnia pulex]|uniref:Uncharacterized protein n=1 Tax=Daphnia pulex TaxID=6669 RepID=E9GWV3_DAPPU|nr:hypothetical protein DAPPUDRAFT_249536 [Daphnia pulex]|eukprot:EFX76054.1 hypothetical protein DAPPUDRAFT_249536 [Daphnia pulex]
MGAEGQYDLRLGLRTIPIPPNKNTQKQQLQTAATASATSHARPIVVSDSKRNKKYYRAGSHPPPQQPPPPPPLQLQQQQQQETQNPMTSSVFSQHLGGSGRPLTGSSSPRDPSLPWFSGIVSHEDPTRGGSDPRPIPPPVASPGHSSPTDPDGSDAQSRGSLPPGQQLGSGPSQSVEQQHDDERVYSQNRISNMSQSQKPATIVPQQSQPPGTFGVDAPVCPVVQNEMFNI